MVSVRQYKSTALTTVVVALVFLFGVALVVDPDSITSDRVWGIVLLAAGVIGIWSMNTKQATQGVELRGLKHDIAEIKADITRHHP